VSIDGVPVGDSPLSARELRPGTTHRVVLSNAQGTQQKTLRLRPGETTTVRFEF
jgi:hypothetical protein